jgi:PAS domain S-box-containing protein
MTVEGDQVDDRRVVEVDTAANYAQLVAELTAARQELAAACQEIDRLTWENSDLDIALSTTAEHGDFIEAQLHEANQRLQAEISERRKAQATLNQILETVSKDRDDLELILRATAEHGDMVEYQMYARAVETMRQNEELLQAIAESTPILMLLTQGQDGVINYANSTAGQQLGLEVPSLIGRHLPEFYANLADEHHFQTILSQQGYVANYELLIKRTDGTQFWVSASIHPLQFSATGTFLTTFYDISDRKLAEEEIFRSEIQLRKQARELEARVQERTAQLQEAEKMYRSIFENCVEGIFQLLPNGRYISANPSLAEIYGYGSPTEMTESVTNVGEQLYVQPRRWEELLAYLRGYDSVSEFESEVRRKDGSLIWISESVRVIKNGAGEVLHYEGSVQDITNRRTTEAELRQQRLLSERLLSNVLPQPIAERLKRGQKTIADHFTEVTVLFADLVSFTHLSSHSSPKELVELLNRIFSKFDALAERHGLEKIKTIGDAYMVVGGLPTPTPTHVSAIADMALDLQNSITQFTTQAGLPIQLRVGIHTGPVIAGIIGTRKFSYDLWGNTVNVASRMESQGEPGRIQVTAAVYDRLKKRYHLEARGEIEVKGKGLMPTYWLLGKKTALSETVRLEGIGIDQSSVLSNS